MRYYFFARWLLATQSPIVRVAIMDVEELWGARVPNHTFYAFARVHQYQHVIASRLELAISVEDLRVLMVQRVAGA